MELREIQERLRERRRRGSHSRAGQARLSPVNTRGRIALGADHGGYALKVQLGSLLAELGYEVDDVGTHDTRSVDYPDIAVAVGKSVASGRSALGIVIDGAGLGSCMAANKVAGIRAATCHDERTVINSREHNDANVLVLGSGIIHAGHARRLVRLWLATPHAGGRHARRVAKIDALDRDRR